MTRAGKGRWVGIARTRPSHGLMVETGCGTRGPGPKALKDFRLVMPPSPRRVGCDQIALCRVPGEETALVADPEGVIGNS